MVTCAGSGGSEGEEPLVKRSKVASEGTAPLQTRVNERMRYMISSSMLCTLFLPAVEESEEVVEEEVGVSPLCSLPFSCLDVVCDCMSAVLCISYCTAAAAVADAVAPAPPPIVVASPSPGARRVCAGGVCVRSMSG